MSFEFPAIFLKRLILSGFEIMLEMSVFCHMKKIFKPQIINQENNFVHQLRDIQEYKHIRNGYNTKMHALVELNEKGKYFVSLYVCMGMDPFLLFYFVNCCLPLQYHHQT